MMSGNVIWQKMFTFKLFYSSVHQKRSEPESSCVSMRSGDTQTDLRYYISAKYRIKKKDIVFINTVVF